MKHPHRRRTQPLVAMLIAAMFSLDASSTIGLPLMLAVAWQVSPPVSCRHRPSATAATTTTTSLCATRYGPPLDDLGRIQGLGDKNNDKNMEKERQTTEFRQLLDKVLLALESDRPEHIPSLLTKHTELLLRMPGTVVADLVQSVVDENSDDDNQRQEVEQALDMIVSFVEDFVEQSKKLDDDHKQLLGTIIRTMTDSSGTEREREERLDEYMKSNKEKFTRGFLRHLEGECQRIASAPKVSKDSLKLQETLLVIQARILEEVGKDLGEGALVLGQLIAYEDKMERIAVLEAGLHVRGVAFAQELVALTEEALQGFQTAGDVDPDLVIRVQEIDQRVKEFIDKEGTFQ